MGNLNHLIISNMQHKTEIYKNICNPNISMILPCLCCMKSPFASDVHPVVLLEDSYFIR